LFVTVEEALKAGVPVLMVDLKGDLPNLALAFSDFGPEPLLPWAANLRAPTDPRSVQEVADELATQRRQGLCSWGISEGEIRQYNETTSLRILTPGSSSGELVHLLSALERPSEYGTIRCSRMTASPAASSCLPSSPPTSSPRRRRAAAANMRMSHSSKPLTAARRCPAPSSVSPA
jgi:hypothetical protein